MINRTLLLVIFSIIGGLLTALVHAASVGPEAGPKTLALPGVIPIAAGIGMVAGLLIAPIMVWAMKEKNIAIGVPIVYTFAWLAVLLLNLMQVRFSMYISFSLTIVMICLYRVFGR